MTNYLNHNLLTSYSKPTVQTHLLSSGYEQRKKNSTLKIKMSLEIKNFVLE